MALTKSTVEMSSLYYHSDLRKILISKEQVRMPPEATTIYIHFRKHLVQLCIVRRYDGDGISLDQHNPELCVEMSSLYYLDP